MKVIISTDLQDNFSQFVVVDTFKKVRDLSGVTTLIIHKFKESDFDAGVFISGFHKSGISRFIYINENPSTTLRMVLKGVNGYYFEDEFYLEDEEELLSLLEELGMGDEECTSLANTSLDIVNDFIQAFARGEERIQAPLYLEQVSQAVNELSELTHQQELQINAMGASAMDIFEKANEIIKNMDTHRKMIEKQLEELENSTVNQPVVRPAFGNNIMFFSPYKYIGNAKVLLIRELSPCRYLTSFMLGYLHYLHYELNKRVKLVFVHQKGAGVAAKYNLPDIVAITQESAGVASLYDAEIVATNNPKKEVLRDLLSKQVDVVIVVDRLYGTQDIVYGKVTKVNAVSGKSDLQRFKVKAEDCIFPITSQRNEFFCIPTIKNFPAEVDARYASYYQINKSKYDKLNDRLMIN